VLAPIRALHDRSGYSPCLAPSSTARPGTHRAFAQTSIGCTRTRPTVHFNVGGWNAADLRDATFCLAPSGWGHGWRTYLALAMLCIPVIIQPLVEQAYPTTCCPTYPDPTFVALRFDPVDLERLSQLLRAIDAETICRMRRAAARYRSLVLWDAPSIRPRLRTRRCSYLLLCQRAAARCTHGWEVPRSRGWRARGRRLRISFCRCPDEQLKTQPFHSNGFRSNRFGIRNSSRSQLLHTTPVALIHEITSGFHPEGVTFLRELAHAAPPRQDPDVL
jgi:hypothetical protein